MKKRGVYEIRCNVNGKVYVGSSSWSLAGRWNNHLRSLRRGVHHNRHLQGSWNKYGESAFEFIVLEECEPDVCLDREQYWIDQKTSFDPKLGFNLRLKASSNLGITCSVEHRAKVSAALTGRTLSDETRAKLAKSAKARGIKPEVTAKAHAATKGKPLSEEHKAKLAANLLGRKHPPERVAKQAAALRGYRHSDQVKAYMSVCQKGKKHSEATKAKMAATRKGRKYSDAHRQAISEGHHRNNFARGKRNVSRIVMPSGNVRYRAVLFVNNKKTNLGSFMTEQEANNAYDREWLNHFGPLSPESVPVNDQPARLASKYPVFSFMADDED